MEHVLLIPFATMKISDKTYLNFSIRASGLEIYSLLSSAVDRHLKRAIPMDASPSPTSRQPANTALSRIRPVLSAVFIGPPHISSPTGFLFRPVRLLAGLESPGAGVWGGLRLTHPVPCSRAAAAFEPGMSAACSGCGPPCLRSAGSEPRQAHSSELCPGAAAARLRVTIDQQYQATHLSVS